MAEKDPIDLIRRQFNKVDAIAGLHADHVKFKDWHAETKDILEKVFSTKSIHTQSFLALRFKEMTAQAFASAEIDKLNVARYKKDIEHSKNILQSAIKELTLDRTLFKKIQTTPETVEVSLTGEYFVSSGIEDPSLLQAIQQAFGGSGLNPIFGNETFEAGESFLRQMERIKSSRFGIYDMALSGKTGPLLELGAALGLGKEMALLYKKGSILPMMLNPFERIEYETASDLIEKLKGWLLKKG